MRPFAAARVALVSALSLTAWPAFAAQYCWIGEQHFTDNGPGAVLDGAAYQIVPGDSYDSRKIAANMRASITNLNPALQSGLNKALKRPIYFASDVGKVIAVFDVPLPDALADEVDAPHGSSRLFTYQFSPPSTDGIAGIGFCEGAAAVQAVLYRR